MLRLMHRNGTEAMLDGDTAAVMTDHALSW